MANVNPGPASTGTQNTVAGYVPVNTQVNSDPLLGDALRCLAVGKAISVNSTGDVAVLPIKNSSRWNIQAIVAANLSVGAGTSVAIGFYTAALQVGTTISSPGILSGLVAYGGVTTAYRPAVANVSFVGTGSNIYVNCQTTAGTACTIDIFVYGYDLS